MTEKEDTSVNAAEDLEMTRVINVTNLETTQFVSRDDLEEADPKWRRRRVALQGIILGAAVIAAFFLAALLTAHALRSAKPSAPQAVQSGGN